MSDATYDYPLDRPEETNLSLSVKLWRKRLWRTLKWRLKSGHDLSSYVGGLDQLAAVGKDEVLVMTRERNGIRFIRSFLRHYRSLGADRFVIIDENSTDGTREFLADQADVIMLPATTSFAEAMRGNMWINAALSHLPKNLRIIFVDSDEYLVFGDGSQKLADLFKAMKVKGLHRLAGIMLDFYPPKPIKNAIFDGADDTYPWDIAPYFDADGYTLQPTWQGPRLMGGVRKRLFSENLYLTKFPAMFNTGRAIIDKTAHFPQPVTSNKMPIGCGILHFKYFNDFVEEHRQIVERGVHNKGAQTYQAVLDQLSDIDVGETFDFTGPTTQRYTGPAQLCELGLISDIFDR